MGAVRRLGTKPGISVISFSADPMDEAILRASSARNSRGRSGEGMAFLPGFFIVGIVFYRMVRGPGFGTSTGTRYGAILYALP